MNRVIITAATVVLVASGTLVALATPAVGQTYQTVALTGQPAPGTATGVDHSDFGAPALDNAGRVAYIAFLTGSEVTDANDIALYTGGVAAPQLVARSGDAGPGTAAGEYYANFASRPILNDVGQVAYLAILTRESVTPAFELAIYAGSPTTPQLVARVGRPAPSTPAGVSYADFAGRPRLNNAGQVAYFTFFAGDGVTFLNDSAIYAGSPAGPQLVAREGDAAPGTPAGVIYAGLELSAFNHAGQVAYLSALTGPGVTLANQAVMYAGDLAAPMLVARGGDAAPGTAAGVHYAQFTGGPALNDVGEIAYVGTLAGSGVTDANDEAIFAGGFDAPQLVARLGHAAPGTAAGVTYASFRSPVFVVPPVLNDVGQVAYFATLTGNGVTAANDTAIYAGDFAAPQLVAREGDAAPGAQTGLTYSSFGSPDLNNAGQVVYFASLIGTGVTFQNDVSLFVFDPLGGNLLIVREGSLFDVDPTADVDLRTVANDGIGFDAGLSNDGTLAFKLSFIDGTSGVFTAVIPEPASLASVALAGLIAVRRRA